MELINFMATDGVNLEGILYKASSNISEKIILSVHGMTSNCFKKRDIEIAKKSKIKDIRQVAESLNIGQDDLILYGNDKAKIKLEKGTKKGKLVLVTAINPTPYGEGKTTISIGLGDALKKLNKNTIITLRQPSMGPVFGMKGGATGGGYSQVVPMEDINIHFTGDFHAITSANNLLSSAIDNHIENGNELHIKEILFDRLQSEIY